jgi:hypothetical protein
MKLRKVVANHDFSLDDLVESILNDVDLEDYAKELASKAQEGNNVEERAVEETKEEAAEEADDEAENKY